MRQHRIALPPLLMALAAVLGCVGEIADTAGPTDGIGGADQAIHCDEPVAADTPLRRLTRRQYANTVQDLLGVSAAAVAQSLPGDDHAGPFPANYRQPVTTMHVRRFMEGAEAVAEQALGDLDGLLPCDPGSAGESECAMQFIESFGLRAFRRPLSETDREELMAVYQAGAAEGGFTDGVRLVITAALQAPDFLYIVEPKPADDGESVVALTPYELASRLSYFLWNSMPDEPLLDAAASGALETREGLRAEASRLLEHPRGIEAIEQFHAYWLGIQGIHNKSKDPQQFLYYDGDTRAAMYNETIRFADYVVREGDSSLWTLMMAPFSFLEEPLFPIYEMSIPPGHNPDAPITVTNGERSGVLTQASVLASHSHSGTTSSVQRGDFILKNLLCIHLQPPAIEVDDLPPPDPSLTTRERFELHTEEPGCASCHSIMDPIGFGFEHYNPVGAWREYDGDNPVDASGELSIGNPNVDGAFNGAVELIDRLMDSEELHRCVPTQWVQFALQRPEADADVCDQERLYRRFVESGFDIRDLILNIVEMDSFRFHPAQQL
jgi:hypothetical protein